MNDVSFKKDGTDPEFARKPFIGFQWVGLMAQALGLIPDPAAVKQAELANFYRGGKRPAQRPKRRRNMLLVSKRVRRKHRRAA